MVKVIRISAHPTRCVSAHAAAQRAPLLQSLKQLLRHCPMVGFALFCLLELQRKKLDSLLQHSFLLSVACLLPTVVFLCAFQSFHEPSSILYRLLVCNLPDRRVVSSPCSSRQVHGRVCTGSAVRGGSHRCVRALVLSVVGADTRRNKRSIRSALIRLALKIAIRVELRFLLHAG